MNNPSNIEIFLTEDELFIFEGLTLLIAGLFVGLSYLFVNRQERFAESERRRKVAEGVLELASNYGLHHQMAEYKRLSMHSNPGDQDLLDGKIQEFGIQVPKANGENLHSTVRTRRKFVARHFQTSLSVPLTLRGEVNGSLTLYYVMPTRFTNENIAMVTAFADHAALDIENNSLHEQSKLIATLQERQKISRDLHDSLSQVLYGIGLGARTAKEIIINPRAIPR